MRPTSSRLVLASGRRSRGALGSLLGREAPPSAPLFAITAEDVADDLGWGLPSGTDPGPLPGRSGLTPLRRR